MRNVNGVRVRAGSRENIANHLIPRTSQVHPGCLWASSRRRAKVNFGQLEERGGKVGARLLDGSAAGNQGGEGELLKEAVGGRHSKELNLICVIRPSSSMNGFFRATSTSSSHPMRCVSARNQRSRNSHGNTSSSMKLIESKMWIHCYPRLLGCSHRGAGC